MKQSGTQCYKDAAFHPVPRPDDEFSRSLLTFLVSVLPLLSTFKYFSGRLFICSIYTEHLLRKDPELGILGTQRGVRGWPCTLCCSCLECTNHNITKQQWQNTRSQKQSQLFGKSEPQNSRLTHAPGLLSINPYSAFPWQQGSWAITYNFTFARSLNHLLNQLSYLQGKKWFLSKQVLRIWSIVKPVC